MELQSSTAKGSGCRVKGSPSFLIVSWAFLPQAGMGWEEKALRPAPASSNTKQLAPNKKDGDLDEDRVQVGLDAK